VPSWRVMNWSARARPGLETSVTQDSTVARNGLQPAAAHGMCLCSNQLARAMPICQGLGKRLWRAVLHKQVGLEAGSSWEWMVEDIAQEVLACLDASSLKRFRLVCGRWRKLADRNVRWLRPQRAKVGSIISGFTGLTDLDLSGATSSGARSTSLSALHVHNHIWVWTPWRRAARRASSLASFGIGTTFPRARVCCLRGQAARTFATARSARSRAASSGCRR
jgi:F-box domain